MWMWLLRRLGQILPTLLILSFLIFGLQQLMPGDPAMILAGEERGDPQVLAQIRAELWLDRPLHEQYLRWIGNVLAGDFGFSWRIRMPVAQLILEKLPVTAQLATMSFPIGALIGVPMGILSAVRRDCWADWLANAVALFGISTPNFWLGIMLILLISVQLGWLPPSGYVPLTEDFWQSIATTIMPAFVLGTNVAGVLMRHTRAAMLTALGQDYVRTARAKGLAERRVIYRHALKNAAVPFLTVSGLSLGFMLSGTIVIETVFSWPGLGRLIVQAVPGRDFPVIQAAVFLFAVLFVAVNLVVDLLQGLLDPRARVFEPSA
jgi:peptide/nickel transport system permease protein